MIKSSRSAACVLIAGLAAADLMAAATESALRATVETDAGLVRGVVDDGIVAFKGIPYAAPPTGALRWRPPQPPTPWDGVRDADRYGHICVQTLEDDNGVGKERPDEDCLTLNVWAPADPDTRGLPVMVWIYGGGFVHGSGSALLYDGTKLARRGVMLVTFNYRLGRFGFFAHPALSRQAHGEPLGNYALMDMLAVLRWVQRNAGAFGGDPGNVTIFGESAGGIAVNLLMISPAARGLFHRAVAESGAGRERYRLLSGTNRAGWSSAETAGRTLAESLGIRGDDDAALTALRALPADEILAAGDPSVSRGGGPIVDATIVPSTVAAAYRRGLEAPVPYVVGYNSMEFPSSPEAFERDLAGMVGVGPDDRARIADAYPDPATFQSNVLGDIVFAEPARFLARLHASHGQPTYLYRFSVLSESMRGALGGTPHAQERQYVFDNLSASPWPTDDNDEVQASYASAYWVAFARCGDPNGNGRPRWPRFAAGGGQLLDFTNRGPVAESVPFPERLDTIAEWQEEQRPTAR